MLETLGNFLNQESMLTDLEQDPMLYDVAQGKMVSQGIKAKESYGAIRRGRVPGVTLRKQRRQQPQATGLVKQYAGGIPNLNKISLVSRAVIAREIRNDPSMIPYLKQLLGGKKPTHAFHKEIRKVLINELDPARYPELAGRWAILRNAFRRNMKWQRLARVAGMGDANMLTGTSMLTGVSDLAAEAEEKPSDTGSSIEKMIGVRVSPFGKTLANIAGSLFDAAKPMLQETLKRNLETPAHRRARRLAAAQAAKQQEAVSRGQYQDIKNKELALQQQAALEALAKNELKNQQKVEKEVTQSEKRSMLPYAIPIAAASIPIIFRK